MKNLANLNIQRMQPYCPPLENRQGYEGILLDFNEATVPISPKVQQTLGEMVKANQFQLYPAYDDFNRKLASYAEVKADQVMVTNGSDQAIDIIFRTFTAKNDTVVIPSPSFAMFYQCAEAMGNRILTPAYQTDLGFPTNEVIKSITSATKLIVICNPNNPTGTLVQLDEIESIVKKSLQNDALIYVDEAYYEFSKVSAATLIEKFPNLIITRTFSKAFGLAALRIGYAIAQTALIEEMLKIRGPYDVNTIGLKAASAALDDRQAMEKYADEVMNKAKPLVEQFFSENEIEFYPSSANFILFKPKNAEFVFSTLRTKGVLTRPRNGKNIDQSIRVSIGTEKQMREFIEIYRNLFINRK